MRTPSDAPSVSLPRSGRRRLVRSGIVIACVLYVGVLLLLPLVGIVYTALEPGWSKVVETFTRPDVQHAFFLTGVITAITLVGANEQYGPASRNHGLPSRSMRKSKRL